MSNSYGYEYPTKPDNNPLLLQDTSTRRYKGKALLYTKLGARWVRIAVCLLG